MTLTTLLLVASAMAAPDPKTEDAAPEPGAALRSSRGLRPKPEPVAD